LEVTGIRAEADAKTISGLLRTMFPAWHQQYTYYEDQNSRELGWKVVITRDREHYGDDWQRVG
jgi:hypothetical protein